MEEEKIRRYNYLFNRSNEVFLRMENNISSLNSQNTTFIGIILGLNSIIIAIFLFLLQSNWTPTHQYTIFLVAFFILNLFSLGINAYILKPTHYKELKIFDKGRFDELLEMDEETLYSDFLDHIRDAHQYNDDKYNKRISLFRISMYTFMLSNIILIIFILVNIFLW